jgi:hypothetical protein
MPHSTYPQLAHDDYPLSQDIFSSYQEPFHKAYLNDTYPASPEYNLAGLFDTDRPWNQSFISREMLPSNSSKPQSFNPMMFPTTGTIDTENQPGFEQSFFQAPFGQLDQYDDGYALDPASMNIVNPASFSPMTESSRTPSLCDDTLPQAHSPCMSPHLIKIEPPFSPGSPGSPEEQAAPKRALRKRGRPRLDRSEMEIQSPTSSSSKNQRAGRLPHNQVERKYREGLNSELERLRRAVPTLPHSEDGGIMGQPKPSKAMVLSSAIDYIRSIEKERDALRAENETLKQGQGEYKGWTRGINALDDFLIDP